MAILDDYAGVALESADWSVLDGIAEIEVFREHLSEEQAAAALHSFDVLCTIRERMALPRGLIAQLPNLKLVTIIGRSLPNLDMEAATEHGVLIIHPDPDHPRLPGVANATPELAWCLMLATVRHLAQEERRMREGLWQNSVGIVLYGRTLGLLGLGRIGRRMAEYGRVFGMDVIAWSQNLTTETAAAIGVRRVEKDELFAQADILSIHVVLSGRTRGLVTARELGLMKPTSYLVNTSRGPIVEESALIAALESGRIAGAGLDVFDEEPPAPDHPLRTLENVTLTPHLGYVTRETLMAFYGDKPAAIAAFARGAPIRVINTEALNHPRQRPR
ncbi:MAG: D-2-hydroxyacid dehydrogenase family protein [Phenylobacterium sp.]|uniref:D-2-hydroxyacid dehydrogenase family protein n=1 Tax=Phenylobacterium sp. TaxID=1871053 RepID=UPI0027377244|nr:D-2-hydroxyacid dehydrogenase family protein [Phenylobacterium sp.]MDP3175860.1 D-2-hydroxyacid dehydrogenase family protein [Phenylobacterium sp.]